MYRNEIYCEDEGLTAKKVLARIMGREYHQPDQGRERVPEAVRHEVWRRDEGKCVRCSSREKLEFDHIIPISKGGSNTARNIELLCEKCNRTKGDKIS
jgi:5-methylcytosine-specific restriction endonuclease McrA